MIEGINHITLSVNSLEDSFLFYKETLNFKPIMKSSASAYFMAGNIWFCIIQSKEKIHFNSNSYTHLAFDVSDKNFSILQEKIIKSGSYIFKTNETEGDSLYFCDPSGNKLEIHVGDIHSRIKKLKHEHNKDMYFFD